MIWSLVSMFQTTRFVDKWILARFFAKKYAKCGSKLNLKLISTGIWFYDFWYHKNAESSNNKSKSPYYADMVMPNHLSFVPMLTLE